MWLETLKIAAAAMEMNFDDKTTYISRKDISRWITA